MKGARKRLVRRFIKPHFLLFLSPAVVLVDESVLPAFCSSCKFIRSFSNPWLVTLLLDAYVRKPQTSQVSFEVLVIVQVKHKKSHRSI